MWVYVVILLTLLLAGVPSLLAAGANNLASVVLMSEWQVVSQEVDFPRCRERLETSAAERYLSLALGWDPTHQRALLNRGRVAWLEGDCAEAEVNWERALLIAPQDQVAALWLFLTSGADAHTLPGCLAPDDLALYFYQAGRRAEANDAEDAALAWGELSLELSPDQHAADWLARLHQREGRKEEAIAVWQRVAAALPPEEPNHWWALGQAAELGQEWEQAVWAYGQGTVVAQEPYDFWMRQGGALEHLARQEEAEGAYRQALVARPDLADAYVSLGNLRAFQDDYEGAVEWFMKAREVDPGVNPFLSLGVIYYVHGNDTQAKVWLEAALRIAPEDVDSNLYLALTLDRMGEKAQAVTFLERSLAQAPRHRWRLVVELGDWKLALGDREGALAAYQRALEMMPEEGMIKQRIQMVVEVKD